MTLPLAVLLLIALYALGIGWIAWLHARYGRDRFEDSMERLEEQYRAAALASDPEMLMEDSHAYSDEL